MLVRQILIVEYKLIQWIYTKLFAFCVRSFNPDLVFDHPRTSFNSFRNERTGLRKRMTIDNPQLQESSQHLSTIWEAVK
jgi:hypothetical protein